MVIYGFVFFLGVVEVTCLQQASRFPGLDGKLMMRMLSKNLTQWADEYYLNDYIISTIAWRSTTLTSSEAQSGNVEAWRFIPKRFSAPTKLINPRCEREGRKNRETRRHGVYS